MPKNDLEVAAIVGRVAVTVGILALVLGLGVGIGIGVPTLLAG